MTIGMLSGRDSVRPTWWCIATNTPSTTIPTRIPRATLGCVQTSANLRLASSPRIEKAKSHSGRVIQLMKVSIKACSLQGAADAAVLADAPEVDGHQDHGHDRHR